MSKPIRPNEVAKKKYDSLPHEIIDAFNKLIAEKWNGYNSTFTQNEVMTEILNRMNRGFIEANKALPEKYKDRPFEITEEDLFKNHWLDVEDIYREVGWKVEYDKPGYNESYPATFKFLRRYKHSGGFMF